MFMVLITLNSRNLLQDSPFSLKKRSKFSFSKDLALFLREKRFNESPAKHAQSMQKWHCGALA
jgi:hypothetical protein